MPYPATRYCDMTPSMTAAFAASFARVFEELDEAFGPDVVLCHHLYLATAVAVETFAHRRVYSQYAIQPICVRWASTALSETASLRQCVV